MAHRASQAVSCPACGHSVPIPDSGKRIRAGLQKARRRGVRIGRPPTTIDLNQVLELRGRGLSVRDIARQLRVPKSIVGRLIQNAS